MGDAFSSTAVAGEGADGHSNTAAKAKMQAVSAFATAGSTAARADRALLSKSQQRLAHRWTGATDESSSAVVSRSELVRKLSLGGTQPELGIAVVEALCPAGEESVSVDALLNAIGRCVCPRELDPKERLGTLIRVAIVYAHLKRNGGAEKSSLTLGEARVKVEAALRSDATIAAADVHLLFKVGIYFNFSHMTEYFTNIMCYFN